MKGHDAPVLLIAGGGTSGHINPAIAIADAFCARHPDADIRFCGTARGLESRLVPAAGYPIQPIRASGFPNRPSLKALRAIRDFLAGRRACRALIRKYRPFAVVGTGGYVCGPLIAAARGAGVPVLLHEQNAWPGRANRTLSRGARTVCTGYPDTEKYFPKADRVIWTGNPVRASFFSMDRAEARKQLGWSEDRPVVLATGGSQGAVSINRAVLDMMEEGLPESVHVVLAAGPRNEEEVRNEAGPYANLDVYGYLEDMDRYMAAADLLVCRAGALTCAEAAALGKPAVLIPYPYAAGDHQTVNAKALEQAGAAVHVPDNRLSEGRLREEVRSLLNDRARLDAMGRAARSLARPEAAEAVAFELEKLLPDKDRG